MAAPAVPAAAGTHWTSDQPRLSEVAKHLVRPVGIVHTDWFGVADICREDLGIEFDRWQDGVGQLLLAKRDDGTLAHTIGGFGLSICRQTGKTFTLAGAIFGLSIQRPDLLTIWSAHHSKTHMETFMALQAFAARSMISPFVDKVYTGSGDEEIRFINGSRILFGARERGFGRGIPGVDVLISDEGQIMSMRAMQNMLATMNTSRLGLHIYAGTPPYPEDNCEVWMTMRDEALSGESEDSVWIEFGADDDADLDDHAQWRKANPSVPHRTPLQSIMRLRKKLITPSGDATGFKHEALGIYDKDDGSAFDVARWLSLADLDIAAPQRAAVMIDVSPDRRWSTIAVAGEGGYNGAGENRSLVMVESIKGTQGVVPRIQELIEENDIVEVAIAAGGTARSLKPDLTQAAIEFEELSQGDIAAAYSHLQEAIKHATVVHIDQPELNFAIANTQTRFLLTGEAESFDRRGVHVNVSPAIAAAGALYRWNMQEEPMPFIM